MLYPSPPLILDSYNRRVAWNESLDTRHRTPDTPMDRQSRLRRNEDFQRARRDGRSWATPWVVLVAVPSDLDHPRFGFAVGKRLGKAVVRNRVKRRLREAVRLQRAQVAPGWDLVFIARDPIRDIAFDQLSGAITQLLKRARLLRPVTGESQDENSRPGSN